MPIDNIIESSRIREWNRIEKQERSRKEAYQNASAKEYAALCNLLGVEPEDPLLYEMGMADIYYG